MKTAARTYSSMRRYLKNHMKIGDTYVIEVPAGMQEVQGVKKALVKKKKMTFERLYPYHAQFRSREGICMCFPLYETIRLIRGERYVNGIYRGSDASLEDREGLILI